MTRDRPLPDDIARVVEGLDHVASALWDMVGLAAWVCQPPVCLRLEFQYIREGRHRVVYLASGTGGPRPGQGVELQLTRRVQRPEDYTGSYLGGSSDVNLRGMGYGIGGATGFPWGRSAPIGISIGLSSPGPSLWLCDYTILGQW
jgi:hypothetical protein